MKQIQQHEWKSENGYDFMSKCIHCGVIKISDRYNSVTYIVDKHPLGNEPACITRYPDQEAGKS
jgi:hypothetical protein